MSSSGTSFKYAWVVAVVIACAASTISNFGMNLQKLALTYRAAGNVRRPVYMALWVLGFVGIVGGAGCDFAALAFGAQSIVAPLGSWTLVANSVIAPAFLGERITRRDLLATALIIAGCTLSVATASHKDEIYTTEQLFSLYATLTFGLYIASVIFIVATILLTVRYVERLEQRYGSTSAAYLWWFKFHRFSYSCLSGVIGAQSVLFAKTVVELVTGTIVHHERVFLADWRTYPVLLGLATTLTLQVYYMQCGLARWDALYCVPIFSSFWILVSVIGGGVFYSEFASFDALSIGLFPLGILLCIVGVYALSQRNVEAARAVPDVSAAAEAAAAEEEGEAVPLVGAQASAEEAKGMTTVVHEHSPLLRPAPTSRRASGMAAGGDAAAAASRAAWPLPGQGPVVGTDAALTFTVEFTARYLGLALRKTQALVMAEGSNLADESRIAEAWVLAGKLACSSGLVTSPAASDAAAYERLAQGDVLMAINGDSCFDVWVSYADVVRRLAFAPRPLRLTFRRFEWSPARLAWLRATGVPQPLFPATTLLPAETTPIAHGMLPLARVRAGTQAPV
ncbi:hypothetical protein EON68_01615, partial [archaeon]